MKKSVALVSCLALASLGYVACGKSGGGGRSGTGGSAGIGGTGGTGGASGTGGAGGSSKDASADAPADALADAPVDVDLADGSVNVAACRKYYNVLKALYQSCTPGLSTLWGPLTLERFAEHCALEIAAPGSAATLVDVVDCANHLQTLGCTNFMSERLSGCITNPGSPYCTRLDPAVAQCNMPAGTLADGAACFSYLQCKSGYCKGDASGCGVCAARSAANGSCSEDVDCQLGLVCHNNACTSPLAIGSQCGATSATCAWGSSCVGGMCKAWRTLGQSCGVTAGQCDRRLGIACISGTCTQLQFSSGGELCADTYTSCYNQSTCQGNICEELPTDGAPCGSSPSCRIFSTCRSGTCVRDNPGYCQ